METNEQDGMQVGDQVEEKFAQGQEQAHFEEEQEGVEEEKPEDDVGKNADKQRELRM